MRFTGPEQAMLAGEDGVAKATAMRLLVDLATAVGAEQLVKISSAHIDGCLYHGESGVDFARLLVEGGAKVAVPTTLNVSSLDLLHPDLYRGDQEEAAESRSQMDAYLEMGCQPTWTCAPYQLPERPSIGDQIAWGESNAIVFANSVLGARTERYGDFMDICCALTGRAPLYGLHTDEGRSATIVFDLDIRDELLDDEVTYPLLGGVIGNQSGSEVVAIRGLDHRAGEDRLKALGAAGASTGSTAMFHAIGVTPEAPDLAAVTRGTEYRTTRVDAGTLASMFKHFDRDHGPLGAVSVGTPHFSFDEFSTLHEMIGGRRSKVPFMVNTGRDVLARIESAGFTQAIQDFGATIVTDTCVYITPILDQVSGVLMTNSGKAAFYAPGNLGVGVTFGSLADCVESASSGRVVRTGAWT